MALRIHPPSRHTPLKAIFRAYLGPVRMFALPVSLVFILYAVGLTAFDVIPMLYYKKIFDVLAASTPGAAGVWATLFHLFLMLAVLIVLGNVCFRVADFLMVYAQANILRELQNNALEALLKHSYGFFTGSFTGGLVAKVKRFARSFETFHDRIVFDFWHTIVQLTGVLVMLLFLMPLLAAFFVIWCIVYIAVSYAFVRFRLPYDFREAEADSAVTGRLADIITNILNLKMFASIRRERASFGTYTQAEYRARVTAWYLSNGFHAIQGASMAILEIVGMYLALSLWMQGAISVGTVVLAQSSFALVMHGVWNLGRAMGDVFKALSQAEEMVAIMEKPLEVKDPALPEPVRITSGAIRFINTSFRYAGGREVFADFALHIPAGQRLGIVGHSGAGKSTLFKLLLRFADVMDGSITIDGQNIREVKQSELRRAISYVPQDPVLFHRSLLENIAYALPEASEEDVIRAAKGAHAHEFIQMLPDGYQTFVGERGVKLSGGERQRIALARVILKNAPILLLDEATSSLDSISEAYIQEQLLELMRGRTTLAIAHRISTITRMDRIIVMDAGCIVEDGSHGDLLEKNGVYAEFWSRQSQGFLPDEAVEEEEGAEDPLESMLEELRA